MPLQTSAVSLRMKDGTRYRVQLCVEPGSACSREMLKVRIVEAMHHLSSQSRWQRFAAPVSHLSDSQLSYLADLDNKLRVAWCASTVRDGGDLGIGLGRYIALPEDLAVAEFALTVIDEFQGRGVGRELLKHLIESAGQNRIHSLCGYVLPGNRSMLALSRRFGASVEQQDAETIKVIIPVPA